MDNKIRKVVLRNLTYGLYVLTAKSENSVTASTITWLSQVSMDPALIMIALRKNSKSYHNVSISEKFAVNIIGANQKDIASSFFKDAIVDELKINGFPFRYEKTGAPVLLDTPHWFECKLIQKIFGGDHDIFIAEIINAGINNAGEPLILSQTGWNYGG